MRARLVASLAAVVVALAVVKLRLDHTSQAQAQAAVLGVVSDSLLLIARSDDSGSAPQIEVAFNAPAPPAPQHSVTTASPVSLPAVDHFEGWVPSARAIEPAPTLIESLASPVAADETTEASASDEIYSAVAAEPEPATGSVVTLTAVRLREQPARTARTLRSIVAGSRLAVIGASDQGWTQVRARDGTLGWIIASALRPV